MKHTIYSKLLISYLIYGVIAFSLYAPLHSISPQTISKSRKHPISTGKHPSLQVTMPVNTLAHPCRLAISRIT